MYTLLSIPFLGFVVSAYLALVDAILYLSIPFLGFSLISGGIYVIFCIRSFNSILGILLASWVKAMTWDVLSIPFLGFGITHQIVNKYRLEAVAPIFQFHSWDSSTPGIDRVTRAGYLTFQFHSWDSHDSGLRIDDQGISELSIPFLGFYTIAGIPITLKFVSELSIPFLGFWCLSRWT